MGLRLKWLKRKNYYRIKFTKTVAKYYNTNLYVDKVAAKNSAYHN